METPHMDLRAGPTRKVTRRTWRLCKSQNTHATSAGIEGVRTYASVPLLRILMEWALLQAMATGAFEA